MDEASQPVANPPFETPPQTPHTSRPYETPPQTPRWSDYDDDDDSWIPEEIKATQQPEDPAPEQQPASSITVVEREVDDDEEALTDQELAFGEPSTAVHQPQPTRPWLEPHGSQDGASPSESTKSLFSDFDSVDANRERQNERDGDEDGEVRSVFSDSSSDESDGEPSEEADNDHEDSEQDSSAQPSSKQDPSPQPFTEQDSSPQSSIEQDSYAQPPSEQTPGFENSTQERSAEPRKIAQPADPRQFETGGNSPDLNYIEQKNGPFVPEPGSDYGQLKRLVELGQELRFPQAILWRRLAKVQDKHVRHASGDTADDEYRYAKMLQRQEESEKNPSVRTKPIAPSPFNPEWDTMEQQLERGKRKVHNLTAALRNARADRQADMEKAKRDIDKDEQKKKTMQKEMIELGKELEFVREQLDDAVNEDDCQQFQRQLQIGQWQETWQQTVEDLHEKYGRELAKKKSELQVKTEEVELVKTKFMNDVERWRARASERIADLEKKLAEKVDDVEAAKKIKELEELLQQTKTLNTILGDDKDLLSAKNDELSEKVQELEKKETSWLEIFGLRRMDRSKRRRSEGEIYMRTQENENLERRLQECSERFKAETRLKLHFKRSYEVLSQELTTEKNDTAELLSEMHQLSDELQKSKRLIKEKEQELQTLADEVRHLLQEKSSLDQDLRTIKLEVIRCREADSPTHYISTFFDLAELDSAQDTASALRAENKALRSNFDKLKHLIPPQEVSTLEAKHQSELNSLEHSHHDLRNEYDTFKAHHADVVSALKDSLSAAHATTAKAEQTNAPLLHQCESLAAQISSLAAQLRSSRARVSELEDQLDPHYAPGFGRDAESRLSEANERVRLYEEKSALVRKIDELTEQVCALERQAAKDARTMRAQEERMRGLEDDVVYALASRRASSRRRGGRRTKGNAFDEWSFVPDAAAIDAAVVKQRNADAKAWAEREDRWEREFGVRTRLGGDGKIWLEAGGVKRRKSLEALRKGRQEAFRENGEMEREEGERVRRGIRMGVRRWGWR